MQGYYSALIEIYLIISDELISPKNENIGLFSFVNDLRIARII